METTKNKWQIAQDKKDEERGWRVKHSEHWHSGQKDTIEKLRPCKDKDIIWGLRLAEVPNMPRIRYSTDKELVVSYFTD